MPRRLFVQHVLICGTLYEWMGSPIAAEAERKMFIEAMCEEATCDLLCWSMETALSQGHGDAQAEHVHACAPRSRALSAKQAPNTCHWSFQAPRLGPGVEQRLLTLLRNRILPILEQSLRLWKRGDAPYAAGALFRCMAHCFGSCVFARMHLDAFCSLTGAVARV